MKTRLRAFFRGFSGPEVFLLGVLLLFGSIACLSIPISAGYDEETHFVRAWEMAHLYFIPNEQLGSKLPFPAIYWELSYRRQAIVEAELPGLWAEYGSLRIDAHDYIYSNVVTRSVYSPALLLPQAFVLRLLGLSLQLPALAVYYACRFTGLLCYLILCWLGLRSIPFGKWLLAVLMVSPMALFQASSISADTISNGIGFLFLGASLGIAARDQIDWKHWLLQLGLIALLFTAKVNLIFLALLPFLLIRPGRFKMKLGWALLAVAAVVLLLVEVAGWSVVAYSHFTRALEGASPRGQLQYILSAPLQFGKIIALDIWTNGLSYLQGWVGVYGYNYWPVPALTYLLYPLAVLGALFVSSRDLGGRAANSAQGVGENDAAESGARLPGRKGTRAMLAILFVIGALLTIVSLYVAFTPVGSQYVSGVQGRYFTPVIPLLLLALVGWRPIVTISGHLNAVRRWSIGLALAALVLYTGGLLLSYHVPCGSEYYRLGLCMQPVYKNWSPASASSRPVTPALTLKQEIVPRCVGLQEADVWVNAPGTDPAGTTTFTLHATRDNADVGQQTLTNADIPKSGWVRLTFSPQSASQNQLYLLTINGTGGIRVGYSLKADYTDGKLYENGVPVSQDVLFQYGCRAGLEKALAGLNIGTLTR
ncbi:MAG TPA: DUF2142 domain-containing protein [Chloroflexota bacterium]